MNKVNIQFTTNLYKKSKLENFLIDPIYISGLIVEKPQVCNVQIEVDLFLLKKNGFTFNSFDNISLTNVNNANQLSVNKRLKDIEDDFKIMLLNSQLLCNNLSTFSKEMIVALKIKLNTTKEMKNYILQLKNIKKSEHAYKSISKMSTEHFPFLDQFSLQTENALTITQVILLISQQKLNKTIQYDDNLKKYEAVLEFANTTMNNLDNVISKYKINLNN